MGFALRSIFAQKFATSNHQFDLDRFGLEIHEKHEFGVTYRFLSASKHYLIMAIFEFLRPLFDHLATAVPSTFEKNLSKQGSRTIRNVGKPLLIFCKNHWFWRYLRCSEFSVSLDTNISLLARNFRSKVSLYFRSKFARFSLKSFALGKGLSL